MIIKDEKKSFRQVEKGILFFAIGLLLVVMITWLNGHIGSAAMDLSHFSIGLGIKLFLIGMVAISAMFLPEMSLGSSRILFALIGIALVLGMQKLREKNEVAVRAGA